MTNLANISIKDDQNWNTYLDLIYPIGSIYISYNSTSPANLFGGSWSNITGYFLRASSDTDTGGSNSHTHQYGVSYGQYKNSVVSGEQLLWNGSSWVNGTTKDLGTKSRRVNAGLTTSLSSNSYTIDLLGSYTNTSSSSFLPKYQNVYCWYRTA